MSQPGESTAGWTRENKLYSHDPADIGKQIGHPRRIPPSTVKSIHIRGISREHLLLEE